MARLANIEIIKAQQMGYFFDRNRAIDFIEQLTKEMYSRRISLYMWRVLGADYDLRDDLGEFRVPVLLVQGQQDPMESPPPIRFGRRYCRLSCASSRRAIIIPA